LTQIFSMWDICKICFCRCNTFGT